VVDASAHSLYINDDTANNMVLNIINISEIFVFALYFTDLVTNVSNINAENNSPFFIPPGQYFRIQSE